MKVKRIDNNHIKIVFDNDEENKPFREALGWNEKYGLLEIICELKGYYVEDYNKLSNNNK